jgi:hypothetical protein
MSNKPENRDANKIDDSALDDYLGGDSDVSRGYDALGAECPPPELDERILAEAERAAKVRPFPFAQRTRWLDPPVAIAATLLLSFSLVMSIITLVPMETDDGFEPGRSDSKLRQRTPIEADEVRETALPEDAAKPGPIEEMIVTTRAARKERAASDAGGEMFARALAPSSAKESVGASEIASIIVVIREHLLSERPESAPGGLASEEADMPADLPANMAAVDRLMSAAPRAATEPAESGTISAEVRLQEIVRLYDDQQEAAAARAIADFRRSFPEHPVSVWLSERGY